MTAAFNYNEIPKKLSQIICATNSKRHKPTEYQSSRQEFALYRKEPGLELQMIELVTILYISRAESGHCIGFHQYLLCSNCLIRVRG